MNPLPRLWTDVRILLVDTGRVWWRLLPQVLGIYLMGWLGSELALKLAAAAGDLSAWLALGVFSFSFLCQLAAIVLILRLAGRELGIRDLIPDEERDADDRDSSMTHLLAVTLLPFLGIYAAFGQVQEAAATLSTEQTVRYGVLGGADGVLGVLNAEATQHRWRLLLILAVTYLVRRVVDYLHERTGRSLLGFLVALLESFFILVVIMGGIRVWQQAKIWLGDRAFMGWLASVRDTLATFFSIFAIDLPQVLVKLATLFWDQVWPVFWEVLSQPIIWLAVAALIYGSRVLSLAELWRKGQPIGSRLPIVSTFARRAERLAARRTGPPPAGIQRMTLEVREALLGDIDDKYLPTFHSLRLVLRAGTIFLGALVLVYAVQEMAKNYLDVLTHLLTGGHEVNFWVVGGPAISLLPNLLVEPLRICLLAVAFRRCLELFHARSEQSDTYVSESALSESALSESALSESALSESALSESARAGTAPRGALP